MSPTPGERFENGRLISAKKTDYLPATIMVAYHILNELR